MIPLRTKVPSVEPTEPAGGVVSPGQLTLFSGAGGPTERVPADVPLFKSQLVDPPWPERGSGSNGGKRGANRYYDLVKVVDLPALIRTSPLWNPHTDSHLYLWVTNNFFAAGLWLMKELGYVFIHPVTWAKGEGTRVKKGIGKYRYGETEHMLFGVRGKAQIPHPLDRGGTLLGGKLIMPSKTHSEKPIEQYAEIETVSPGPCGELFARKTRWPRWWYWGRLDGEKKPAVIAKTDRDGQVTRLAA